MAYTRGWTINCTNSRVRLKAELDQARQEIAMLNEQLRIVSTRVEFIPSHRWPHYPPIERLAILELKERRGSNL